MKILIRDYNDDDIKFIKSAWAKTLMNNPIHYFINQKILRDEIQELIEKALKKSLVAIACDQRRKDQNFGFIVRDHECLHFAYTKSTFRELGIFNTLWNETKTPACIYYSTNATCREYSQILQKKNLQFNPFKLYTI